MFHTSSPFRAGTRYWAAGDDILASVSPTLLTCEGDHHLVSKRLRQNDNPRLLHEAALANSVPDLAPVGNPMHAGWGFLSETTSWRVCRMHGARGGPEGERKWKLSSRREDKGIFRAEKAYSELGLAVMVGRTVSPSL